MFSSPSTTSKNNHDEFSSMPETKTSTDSSNPLPTVTPPTAPSASDKTSFSTPANQRTNRATPVTQPMTPPSPELDGYLGDPDTDASTCALFRTPGDLVRQSRRSFRSSITNGNLLRKQSNSVRSSRRKISSTDGNESPSSDSSPDRESYWPTRKAKRATSPFDPNEEVRFNIKAKQSRIFLVLVLVGFLSAAISSFSVRSSMKDVEQLVRHYERMHTERRISERDGPTEASLRGKLVRAASQTEETFAEATLRQIDAPADTGITVKKRKKQNSKLMLSSLEEREEGNAISPSILKRFQKKKPPSLKFARPPPLHSQRQFDEQDDQMYVDGVPTERRVVYLGKLASVEPEAGRTVDTYPADFTDNTQFYGLYDSDDERLSGMEIREPLDNGECVPMQDWQTTYHPSCNAMHEFSFDHFNNGDDYQLFGTKGFWRNAWRIDSLGGATYEDDRDTIVLKTLKFEHNFEDAHFEHDRVDAVAMERLTSSPHVINIFGFCGHSVMTEFADGSRVGELADKSKKKPLARLRIALDIAKGLADVHGIDGDGNATFVHLDINPANVVSIDGTLKLNDFNIGILLRWNTTSNTQCGFPAQYPNPQWRSPEEANNSQHLTEKVDIFSMGHIFFRLVCGHEPWNKLELGGKPSKEEMNAKVQKGIFPQIPESVTKSSNPEVIAIREAMLKCYTFDPSERPSAREIANDLGKALAKLEKKQKSESAD